MTSQTKHFVELSDIVGIQIECKHSDCGVSLLVHGESVASLADRHSTTLTKCPSCGGDWAGNQDKTPAQMGLDSEIKDFLRMVERIRSLEDKLGCQLRFEIKTNGASVHASSEKD
jgi:hypothetical protein